MLDDLKHNDFFDQLQIENEELGKAKLLFSEPLLPDPNFSRSLIYLVDHNPEGAVGFILNKPTGLKITDVLELELVQDFPLFMGGPVESYGLFFLHKLGNKIPGSIEVEPNIFWGGDFDEVKDLMKLGMIGTDEIKFFSGYSGWGPEQLEAEMEEKSWLVKSRGKVNLFGDFSKKSWNSVLKQYGGKHRLLASFPEDPSHN